MLIKSHDKEAGRKFVLYITFSLSFSCKHVPHMVTILLSVEQICQSKEADIQKNGKE